MNKKEALTKLILGLAEYFKSPLSNVELEIYIENLMDYEFASIKKAAKKLVKTEKFMPKVADFVKAIEETKGNSAESAWLELLSAIETYGYYRKPYFNDKTIYAVVQAMGGWEAMCNMPVDRQNFYMKEFVNLYNQYKNRPEVIENALPAGREADKKALGNILRKAKALNAGREN